MCMYGFAVFVDDDEDEQEEYQVLYLTLPH